MASQPRRALSDLDGHQPCAKRSIEQFTKPMEILEPTGW